MSDKYSPRCEGQDCCGEVVPPEGCDSFYDNFDRDDSSTVGNGWEAVAAYSIASDKLSGASAADIMSPATAGANVMIEVLVEFSHDEQEARIYVDGTDIYVGFRPTNFDSSSKSNLYIFKDGAVKTGVATGEIFLNYPHRLVVCISETQIHAYARYGRAVHAPAGGIAFSGDAGLGCLGDFTDGPVVFDNFIVWIVSEDCFGCENDETCIACSGEYSWLVDLTGFPPMVPYVNGDNLPFPGVNCDECLDGFGEYLLEPTDACNWDYNAKFCDGWDAVPDTGDSVCSPTYLRISLRTNFTIPITGPDRVFEDCGARLAISLYENPGQCLTFNPIEQTCVYAAGPHALDTAGPDTVTFYLDPPDQAFTTSGPGRIPECVNTSETTGGVTTWTPVIPPPSITLTRVA